MNVKTPIVLLWYLLPSIRTLFYSETTLQNYTNENLEDKKTKINESFSSHNAPTEATSPPPTYKTTKHYESEFSNDTKDLT